MTFFVSQRVNKFSRCSFRWSNNGFNGFVSKMVISYMLIGFMMTRNVLGWILGVKPLFHHRKQEGKILFTLCNTKNVMFQASVDHFE